MDIDINNHIVKIDDWNLGKYNQHRWYMKFEHSTGRYTPCAMITVGKGEEKKRVLTSLGRFLFLKEGDKRHRVKYKDLNSANCLAENVTVINSIMANRDKSKQKEAKREQRERDRIQRKIEADKAKEEVRANKIRKEVERKEKIRQEKSENRNKKIAENQARIRARLENKAITVFEEAERSRIEYEKKAALKQKELDKLKQKIGRYEKPAVVVSNEDWYMQPNPYGFNQQEHKINLLADFPGVIDNRFTYQGQLYQYSNRRDANIAILEIYMENGDYSIIEQLHEIGLAIIV